MDTREKYIELPPLSALEVKIIKAVLWDLCRTLEVLPENDYAVAHCRLILDKELRMDEALQKLNYKLDAVRLTEAHG